MQQLGHLLTIFGKALWINDLPSDPDAAAARGGSAGRRAGSARAPVHGGTKKCESPT
jgi:hypothetical protein